MGHVLLHLIKLYKGGFMSFLSKLAILLAFISFLTTAADFPNIQFTDMDGVDHDLYTMLDEGKYIYFMTSFDG